MALTDKLTAIADATRAKTGTTEQMTLDEIATAISGISSGGKEITTVQRGFASNSGYSGIQLDLSNDFDTSNVIYIIYTVSQYGSSNWYGNFVTVNCANGTITPVQWGNTSTKYNISYSITGTTITATFPKTSRFYPSGTVNYSSSMMIPLYMIGVKK